MPLALIKFAFIRLAFTLKVSFKSKYFSIEPPFGTAMLHVNLIEKGELLPVKLRTKCCYFDELAVK